MAHLVEPSYINQPTSELEQYESTHFQTLRQIAPDRVRRPTLKSDELLVEVHAVGWNPIDNMIPTGMFKPVLKFQLPATMGSDLAGVVKEIGSRVTRFKPGDAIFASLFDLGTGSLAEFAVVPERVAAPKPANLDFAQAASVPMVGLTSWQALKERRPEVCLRSDESQDHAHHRRIF